MAGRCSGLGHPGKALSLAAIINSSRRAAAPASTTIHIRSKFSPWTPTFLRFMAIACEPLSCAAAEVRALLRRSCSCSRNVVALETPIATPFHRRHGINLAATPVSHSGVEASTRPQPGLRTSAHLAATCHCNLHRLPGHCRLLCGHSNLHPSLHHTSSLVG